MLSFGLLLACLVAVVGLAKKPQEKGDRTCDFRGAVPFLLGLEAANAPQTVVGIVIATQGKLDTRTYCCRHHRPGFRLQSIQRHDMKIPAKSSANLSKTAKGVTSATHPR
jgi:hypothetical protein